MYVEMGVYLSMKYIVSQQKPARITGICKHNYMHAYMPSYVYSVQWLVGAVGEVHVSKQKPAKGNKNTCDHVDKSIYVQKFMYVYMCVYLSMQ